MRIEGCLLKKLVHISLILVSFICLVACGSEEKGEPKPDQESLAKPKAPRVHSSRKDLLFRYIDQASGQFQTATSIADVPEQAREKVIVYDPENDRPGWFFLRDLRKQNQDGSYPCSVLHASQMKLVKSPANSKISNGEKHVVRFFTASWCGVCTQARNYMKKERIRFIEKDIEKDRGAAQELQSFAKKKGVSPDRLNGVPIFIIGSEILFGFDPGTIKRKAKGG